MSVRICVDGLRPSMTERSLHELFSAYGVATVVRIDRGVDGKSLGIAELLMADSNEADAAIEGLHRRKVEGMRLLVFRLPPHPPEGTPRKA